MLFRTGLSAAEAARNGVKIDYDKPPFDTPEHMQWKTHRAALQAIPLDHVGYRGCASLAIVPKDSTDITPVGTRCMVRNGSLEWATLVDIPPKHFSLGGRHREVHWASLRQAELRNGRPTLESPPHRQFDFKRIPTPDGVFAGRRLFQGADVLDAQDTRLFIAFNAMSLSMTTAALRFRKAWEKKAGEVYARLGIPAGRDRANLYYGGKYNQRSVPPYQWMPTAYVGLSTQFPDLNMSTVLDAANPGGRYLRYWFIRALRSQLKYDAPADGSVTSVVDDNRYGIPAKGLIATTSRGDLYVPFSADAMVWVNVGATFKEGDPLVSGPAVSSISFDADIEYWPTAVKELGNNLEPMLKLWLHRCAVSLGDGLFYFPWELVSAGQLDATPPTELVWDLAPISEYFQQDCESFIPPPIPLQGWDDFSGVLPGEIPIDLTPADQRYLPRRLAS